MKKLITYAAPLIMLATSPFTGCSDPSRVANPDITVSVARQYESPEKYTTLESKNLITSNFHYFGPPKKKQRFADLTVVSGPVGSFTGHYSKKSYEMSMLNDENNKALLTIRQIRQEKTHSRVLEATFRNSAFPIVEILRLEQDLSNREIKIADFYNNKGTHEPVTRTTKPIGKFRGGASREGTTIETFVDSIYIDYIIQSDYAPVRMSKSGLGGSKVKVNGKPVYEIKPLFEEGRRDLFKGFDLVANNGKTFARLRATRELKNYDFERLRATRELKSHEKALDFFYEEDKIGAVYLYHQTKSHGKYGPTNHHYVLDVELSGYNSGEKLTNLENMDLIMALMPDQVKMNAHGLQKAERFIDAVRFIYFARNAKKPNHAIRDAALDFATEEDPTTILEAIALMVPNSGLDIEQIRMNRPFASENIVSKN